MVDTLFYEILLLKRISAIARFQGDIGVRSCSYLRIGFVVGAGGGARGGQALALLAIQAIAHGTRAHLHTHTRVYRTHLHAALSATTRYTPRK